MVSAWACAALAAATLCAPSSTATARLRALRPSAGRWWRWRPWTAAPTLLGGLAGLVLLGPAGGLAGMLVGAVLHRRRIRQRAAVAASETTEQLADALRRMTDELRAGRHPAEALDGVAADGPRAAELLAPAATAARLGDGVPSAVRRTAADRADVGADLERVALVWTLADRHGIPLAELLAQARDDLRWRVRFGAAVRAQLAGPRATAAVLTALPAVGLGFGQLVGADPVGVLRGGLLGQGLLLLGIGLVAVGVAWSDRILRSAVPR